MVRHILLFSFRSDVGEDDRRLMLAELRDFPNSFPEMQDFELGKNQSRRDQTYEYGMTVSFLSFGDLDSYLGSERHERFVQGRFRPLIDSRAIASFDV